MMLSRMLLFELFRMATLHVEGMYDWDQGTKLPFKFSTGNSGVASLFSGGGGVGDVFCCGVLVMRVSLRPCPL